MRGQGAARAAVAVLLCLVACASAQPLANSGGIVLNVAGTTAGTTLNVTVDAWPIHFTPAPSLADVPIVGAAFLWEATMQGAADLVYHYINGHAPIVKPGAKDEKYSEASIRGLIEGVRRRSLKHYGLTDQALFQALSRYPIKGLHVLIVGSEFPAYEATALAYGAREVTVVEYNAPPRYLWYPGVSYITPAELEASQMRFDAVISISSIEHDGLGRYGDPLAPWADVDSMRTLLHNHMNPRGLMFLSVPVGLDTVVFNAHRIYGTRRLPLITFGWECVDSFGLVHTDLLLRADSSMEVNQPVFVLRAGSVAPIKTSASALPVWVPFNSDSRTGNTAAGGQGGYDAWASRLNAYIQRRAAASTPYGDSALDVNQERVAGSSTSDSWLLFPGDVLAKRDIFRNHELCDVNGGINIQKADVSWTQDPATGLSGLVLDIAVADLQQDSVAMCVLAEFQRASGFKAAFITDHCYTSNTLSGTVPLSIQLARDPPTLVVINLEFFRKDDLSLVCTSRTLLVRPRGSSDA